MQAIHISTGGLDTWNDATLLEAVLRMLAGVADVVAVRSLGLVSVLYDEHKITPRTILRQVRVTGFDARFARPSSLRRRSAKTPTRDRRVAESSEPSFGGQLR